MVSGSTLSDRYRIEERIAAGGMGAVFAATDERLGRRVAIKVLKDELADDPRFVERFRREARAAGALSHPNVAGVYDFGEDQGRSYMVMELAEGRDLARLLREEGPLSPERTVRIGSQIARALSHAHAAGVVHRDIKPPNVIIGEADRVKVTDFGIARAVGDSTLTATGSVLGTAQYISPEQASGAEVGPKADIYSLGIVLYEMLTGTMPFTGDSAIAVAMRHISDDVPPPSELNRDVPRELDEVVATATQKDPSDRFPDAADMASALEASLSPTAGVATAVVGAGGAVAATERMDQTVWPIPGGRYDPQKLGKAVLAAFAALALIAVILFAMRLGDAGERAADQRREAQTQAQAEDPVTEDAEPVEEEPAYVIPEDIVEKDYRDVEKELEERGFAVEVVAVDSPLPKDLIDSTDPAPGSGLEEGDGITLFVSNGESFSEQEDLEEDQEEEEDDEPGNSEKAKGKGKDKD